MKFINLSRKTTFIIIAIIILIFGYHMFDIFVMRDHLVEMVHYASNKMVDYSSNHSAITHLTIEYNHSVGESINIFDVTDITVISNTIHYCNDFSRNGWQYYTKPTEVIPMNFYSYDTYGVPDNKFLIATAYFDPNTCLFTRLTLGPSSTNFTYTLADLNGLFEDIEELEITSLCLFSPEDIEGINSLPSLNNIYLHDNPVGDLHVAESIKENLPNIEVYYGRYREIVK